MNFKEKLRSIAAKMNLVDKAKNGDLKFSDLQSFKDAYKEEFGVELDTDRSEYEQQLADHAAQAQQAESDAQARNAAALSIIQSALNEAGADSGQPAAARAGTDPEAEPQHGSQSDDIVAAAREIAGALGSMSRSTIPDNAPVVQGSALNVNGPGHTAEYFCGIPHPMFSMSSRFNRIAVNPAVATVEAVNEKEHGREFRSGVESYAKSISERVSLLASNNLMNPKLLSDGITIGVDPKGLGDQYLIRRQDALIARLATIKNVYGIFPRRFGVQDREVMINAFFGDFSQAFQLGKVWKGSIELKPEIGYVDDAMFKTMFGSMKDIERQYIGYLNKEGSDPIKWSLIEWALLNIATKLIEEQNERKILGMYIKPTVGTAGHRLNSGTGVYETLRRYLNEAKITPLPAEYSSYDSGTDMVDTVQAMMLHLAEEVDNLDQYEVILNANHRAKWISGIREIYGKDTDFTGPDGDRIPDAQNLIRWMPYAGKLPLIIVQKPGNIQCLELAAGEMLRIQFDTEMEAVYSWSVWKEGTSAEYAGRPYATKSLRQASGYADQEIFCNFPSLPIAVDATVVTVEGDYRHYLSGENTAAAAITDIVGAKPGVAYMIETGSDSNPQTVAKSGKFSAITKAYAPTTVGDYILVALNDAGDGFLELERCEAEVRTINTALQPNVPGGR